MRQRALGHGLLVLFLWGAFPVGCRCEKKAQTRSASSELVVSASSLDFPNVSPGSAMTLPLTLTNQGTALVTLSELVISHGNLGFSVTAPQTMELGAAESTTVTVRFAPPVPGKHATSLLIRSDADNAREIAVALAGEGVPCGPASCVQPPDFCHQPVGVCVDAACTYSVKADGDPCDDGSDCTDNDVCVQGKCEGEPKGCITPPAPHCTAPDSLASYGSPGTCQAGQCRYPQTDQTCANGCANDVCKPDPCNNVTCNAPPPCFKGGTCVGGSCQYAPNTGAACDDGQVCSINDVCTSTGICRGTIPGSPPGPGVFPAAGSAHTCAIVTDGGLKCWGANNPAGQVGDGTKVDQSTPTDVVNIANVTHVALGDAHSCAVTDGGTVKCWGFNLSGQVGNGVASVSVSKPVTVFGLDAGFVQVAGALQHSCALSVGGTVKCWGTYPFPAGSPQWLVPVDVAGLTGVVQLASNYYHTCALRTGGGVRCWGWNQTGQLGDGTFNDTASPVPVQGLGLATQAVTVGMKHTCALTSSNGVKCWGNNAKGELGSGTVSPNSPNPLDVQGLTSGVQRVVAGGVHTCAITQTGGVKCWGLNTWGQLGDGTTTDRPTPVDVVGLACGVKELALGNVHSCAIMVSGGMKCWGFNSRGFLGDGTLTEQHTPVRVVGF